MMTTKTQNKHRLSRVPMTTSRLMEFFSKKELNMQIGQPENDWPLALTKELIDNALDACESDDIIPHITITVEPDSVSVEDNGPGLPEKVLERSLDYSVRVSDKAGYVSPTRGQLGNALKCVWAAPFVHDGNQGKIEVVTKDKHHFIDVTLDHVKQTPEINHEVEVISDNVKTGTLLKMCWSEIASYLEDQEHYSFYTVDNLIRGYATFNSHVDFDLELTDDTLEFSRKSESCQKWVASQPTSIHWYTLPAFQNLILGFLRAEQETGKTKTVGKFLADFHGLKATAKQRDVAKDSGLSGANLKDLLVDGKPDTEAMGRLLTAMKSHAKEVLPDKLGEIGIDHLKYSLENYWGCTPDSIRYKRVRGTVDGLPYVWEIAFGIHDEECEREREIITGVNWSVLLNCPFDDLRDWLGDMRVDMHDPVTVVAHMACPRLDFVDRGKSRAKLPESMTEQMASALMSLFKPWEKEKEKADRKKRLHSQQLERLRKSEKKKNVDIKEAAYRVMEESYMHASGNNTLPANARQIMYVARGPVERIAGKVWGKSSYFTQTILPNYLKKYPEDTKDWDVVFDSRGGFLEPHTGKQVDLGTLSVRSYLHSWRFDCPDRPNEITINTSYPTSGPNNRFKYALFVEKEGFNPHLERHRIAERYDVAIMSTKGMSVTASRKLVDELSKNGVTILVLRDFDKAGFSIVHTLRSDSFRYKFESTPNVIDIGLRLKDAEEWDLLDLAENVRYKRQQKDPRERLRINGATEEECKFLVDTESASGWSGRRVELNALTSPQFIAFIEAKFKEHGIEKVVPDDHTLEAAYKRTCGMLVIQVAIDEAFKQSPDSLPDMPKELGQKIAKRIEGTDIPWDQALAEIIKEEKKNRWN